MDPDITLLNLLNLFLADMHGEYTVTCDEVTEATEALTQWHDKRGFLPHWPVHLDSGAHFSRLQLRDRGPAATLRLRSECIALLTRVQVGIESENRSVYVEAVRNLGSWARRALDSESPVPFQPQRRLDLVGGSVVYEGRRYQCVRVDPNNTAQVILSRAGDSSDTEWRVHWGLCKLVSEDDPTWHNKPDDWRCPTCKTADATVHGNTVTCANGHESQ